MAATATAGLLKKVRSWFDNSVSDGLYDDGATGPDWPRVISFIVLHVTCVAVIWVGWSWVAVGVAAALYAFRMFFVTAFYHRYFCHRSFQTSRAAQFVFAVLGNSCVQRGPLWWASHHRVHHRVSDHEGDPHSPHQHGLYWAHMGWITAKENYRTDLKQVPDLATYPELRWLDRFDVVVPAILAVSLFTLGAVLAAVAPQLGTNGPQMLVWGFFISTVVLFHATCLVNSAAHMLGRKRYATKDESRNSLLIALVTFGEGWHNNHHFFPGSARQGFYWWEIDLSYYLLKVLSWFRIVWDLRPVPERVLLRGREVMAEG